MMSLDELQKKLVGELQEVDDVAQIVLKGHLILEGLMTEGLSAFVLHEKYLDSARLSFAQKVQLCRATSTSDQDSNMWRMVEAINALRNTLAHSLDASRRAKATTSLRNLYQQEFKSFPAEEDGKLCLLAIGASLGFLHSYLEEVQRLKSIIVEIDTLMNKGALTAAKKKL